MILIMTSPFSTGLRYLTHRALASSDPSQSGPLGVVPHTIRGFLSSGEQISPSFQSFDKCTACSEKVCLQKKVMYC
jgi:hypothetical protein